MTVFHKVMSVLDMTVKEAVQLIGMWFVSQGIWLFFAYLYEFRKWRTLEFVWVASILFLIVNCYIMAKLTRSYSDSAKTKSKIN
ncbi:hypothetical protein COOONC_20587 [Cooperia oncophora]